MSSILKAIRKAEDEKRASDSVAPDLMVDHGQPSPKNRSTVILPMVAGVVVGAVIVAAGILMLDFGDKSGGDDRVTNTPPITKKMSESSQHQPADVKSVAQPSSKSMADGSQKITKEEIQTLDSVKGVEAVVLEEDVKDPLLKPKESEEKMLLTTSAPEKNLATPPGVHLVVSEIFHQKDNANSMAVVNDLPVMLGTYVDSALVKAINKDSVEFEFNGNSFLVPVSEP